MFRQVIFIAALAFSNLAASYEAHCSDSSLSAQSELPAPRPDRSRRAEDLLDEIVAWLSSNYDLPAREHPAIEFVSKIKLAMMRAEDGMPSQKQAGENAHDGLSQREVVALYNNQSKTIFLSDDWVGTSPTDQSVLVHELVHHLQNLASLEFECPRAREKMAYLAQAKWLERFGLTLEHEFDVDMFTVLISSACAY